MPEIKPQAGATDVKMYGYVDFVICLDTTGSMSDVIKNVTNNIADSLIKNMDSKMTKNQSQLDWRGRIIGFGDINCDEPIYEGTFTSNADQLVRELASIPSTGGGDEPESSLDALYLAAQSPWRTDTPVHKVVILFTDATPHAEIHAKTVSSGPRDVARINEEYTKNRIKLFLYGRQHEIYEKLESIPRAQINLWPSPEIFKQLDKMDFSKEFEIMAATISTESAELNKGAALPTKSF